MASKGLRVAGGGRMFRYTGMYTHARIIIIVGGTRGVDLRLFDNIDSTTVVYFVRY